MMLFIELLAISLLGFYLAYLFLPKHLRDLSLPLSYPLAIGIFTFFAFLANLLGIPYAMKTYLLIVLMIAFFTLTYYILNKKQPLQILIEQLSELVVELKKLWRTRKSIFIVLVMLTALPLIPSLYWPTKDWDSIALYDFRSISFTKTGFMDEAISRGYFFGYPLNTSIAQTLVHFNKQYNTAVVHYPFYLSLVLGIYVFLKKETSTVWASVWTIAIASLPSLFGHAQMTYTNLAYSTYLIFAHIVLYYWNQNTSKKIAVLLGIVVGLSIWTRSTEPFWIYPTVWLTLVSIRKKDFVSILMYLLPLTVFRYSWTYFEKMHVGMSTDLLSNTPSFISIFLTNWQKIKPVEIGAYFFDNVITPDLPSYILFAVTFLFSKYLRQKFFVFSFSIILFLFLTIAGTTLYSLFFTTWYKIGGSAQRMTMFLAPLILIYTACISFQLKKHFYEK